MHHTLRHNPIPHFPEVTLRSVAKHRREEGGFVGADVICAQIKNGVSRKRIGFVSKGAPVRGEITAV